MKPQEITEISGKITVGVTEMFTKTPDILFILCACGEMCDLKGYSDELLMEGASSSRKT